RRATALEAAGRKRADGARLGAGAALDTGAGRARERVAAAAAFAAAAHVGRARLADALAGLRDLHAGSGGRIAEPARAAVGVAVALRQARREHVAAESLQAFLHRAAAGIVDAPEGGGAVHGRA